MSDLIYYFVFCLEILVLHGHALLERRNILPTANKSLALQGFLPVQFLLEQDQSLWSIPLDIFLMVVFGHFFHLAVRKALFSDYSHEA